MKRLKTSPKRMGFDIILSLSMAVAALLIFVDRLLSPWILGSAVALGLGHLWTTTFLEVMRNHIYETLKCEEMIDDVYIRQLPVPAWVVGTIERTFFGALVAFDISATAAGMVTWILVKMALDWTRLLTLAKEDKRGSRSLAWSSLLAGMISLFFALIGGLICRKALHP